MPRLLGTDSLERLIEQLHPFQPEPALPVLEAQTMNSLGRVSNLKMLRTYPNSRPLSALGNRALADYRAQYQSSVLKQSCITDK